MRYLSIIKLLLICIFLVPVVAIATELDERNRAYNTVQNAFLNRDFATLEHFYHDSLMQKKRTPSGVWYTTLFYYGIDRALYANKQTLETINAWLTSYPKSSAAQIAYAHFYIKRYETYPKLGNVNNLEPDKDAPAYKELTLAYDYLLKHKKTASNNPNWYIAMSMIAKYQHMEAAQFEKLLSEGLAKFPNDYEIYFHAAQYFSPDFYGSKEDLEKFIESSVQRTKKIEGDSMYARIYWYLIERNFGYRLFEYTIADWSKMRRGFDDIIKRYPDSWNISSYARFACMAKDKQKTAELIQRLNEAVDFNAWSHHEYLQCREYALQN